MKFDAFDDAVTMDDHRAVPACRSGEFVPDEEQVLLLLAMKRGSRFHAGVDEEIVSTPQAKGSCFEHRYMVPGHGHCDTLRKIKAVLEGKRRSYPEICEESRSPICKPDVLCCRVPAKTFKQQVFMIAEQQRHLTMADELVCEFEAFGAFSAAVDDIAQKDDLDRLESLWCRFPMPDYFIDDLPEEIISAMDVADRINPLAGSGAGLVRAFAEEIDHKRSITGKNCHVR